jgi:hypothetical protein
VKTNNFGEQFAFNYALGILKNYNIAIYNADGSSRSAEDVLMDIVREYLKGNISLKK